MSNASRKEPFKLAALHAATLGAVAVTAKLLLAFERHGTALFGRPLDAADYLFRDLLIALSWGTLVGAALAASRDHRNVRRAAHGILVAGALYIGLNVGFFRSFSTPLNRELLGMAGGMGDFSDSALSFLTLANVVPVVVCVTLAALGPWWLDRVQPRRLKVPLSVAGVLASALLVTAAVSKPKLPPMGLDRNAVWEVARMALPRNTASAAVAVPGVDISEPVPHVSITEADVPGEDLSAFAGAAEGMNLVLVVLESTSARYLGAYGAQDDPMPRVSALTEHALVFDRWYAPVPTSMKCLFSYLCSTYPYPDATAESYVAPRLPCRSLPEVLDAEGRPSTFVTTAHFAFNDKLRFLDDRGYDSLWDADNLPATEETFRNKWGVSELAALDQMKVFLSEQDPEQPFFLTYLPIFPHHPFVVPPDEPARFGVDEDFDRYRSALAFTDRVVGELYDTLDELGHLDDTLFVVIADHGEPFEQHVGNRMHGNAIYEENVHVPAIIHNPRLFPAERRVDAIADHTDLAPTLVDLLGIEAPERWQGESMLRGQRDMARFIVDSSFLLLGLRDGDYKYIHDMNTGRDELYDLSVDPMEQDDVSLDHPELVRAYSEHVHHAYFRQQAIFEDYAGYIGGALIAEERDFVPLETLVPVSWEQGWGKLRPDLSVGQNPLNIGGTGYADGLGTHAPGRVEFALDGRFTKFTGAVGRDFAAMEGLVAAEVWVDGVRVWESGPLDRAMDAVPFEIDIADARRLELYALEADGRKRGDHLDWVDVRLQ